MGFCESTHDVVDFVAVRAQTILLDQQALPNSAKPFNLYHLFSLSFNKFH